MRIGLISDIHGNDVSFRAVMRDLERVGVDRIVCLGDVATLGPKPNEIIDALRDLECPCILGNHDEFLLEPELIHTYTELPVIIEAVDWCRSQLTEDNLSYLRTFRSTMEIPLEDGSTFLLYHGSPRSNMHDVLATTPPKTLDQMLGDHGAVVMAGGHTHVQMLRQHRGALVVNPGSVGIPFKEYVAGKAPTLLRHAEYAIVESTPHGIGVDLRRANVDIDELRAAAEASESPIRSHQIKQYRQG